MWSEFMWIYFMGYKKGGNHIFLEKVKFKSLYIYIYRNVKKSLTLSFKAS